MIAFKCSGCGKSLKAKDELAGKTLPCPGCKAPCLVPAALPPVAMPPVPVQPERSDDLVIYAAQATRDAAVDVGKIALPVAATAAKATGHGIVEVGKVTGKFTLMTARLVSSLMPSRHQPPAEHFEPANVECPYCGEEILAVAKKCKHCGEMLDPRFRQPAPAAPVQYVAAAPAPAPSIHITNVNTAIAGGGQYKRWSRLVAMLLSFLIPGLGQLYKGQVLGGILWFIIVAAGYVMLIVPGVVLHILCVLGAGMGDPYR